MGWWRHSRSKDIAEQWIWQVWKQHESIIINSNNYNNYWSCKQYHYQQLAWWLYGSNVRRPNQSRKWKWHWSLSGLWCSTWSWSTGVVETKRNKVPGIITNCSWLFGTPGNDEIIDILRLYLDTDFYFFFTQLATSAPSERIFSQARAMVPWNRSRLSSQTMSRLMLMKSWTGADLYDIVGISDEERLWTFFFYYYYYFYLYYYFWFLFFFHLIKKVPNIIITI